jgi:ATP-dependent Clp protease adapter protein ClpS
LALPSLTQDEKRKALEKAQQMRKARAELRAQLKKGAISFEEVLNGNDAVTQRMKVSYLLRSLPRVGRVKAEKIMQEIGIDESRRIQGLGKRQKEALLARFLDK